VCSKAEIVWQGIVPCEQCPILITCVPILDRIGVLGNFKPQLHLHKRIVVRVCAYTVKKDLLLIQNLTSNVYFALLRRGVSMFTQVTMALVQPLVESSMLSRTCSCAQATTSTVSSALLVPARRNKFLIPRRQMISRRRNVDRCLRASADLQDVIVGGAVLTAVSAALYNGLKVSILACQCSCRPALLFCSSFHHLRVTHLALQATTIAS
jgi:hypothetical protein